MAAHPRCRIVWGGWHPSLFPGETLQEAGVDAVVVGQGELAFADLVERFAGGPDRHREPAIVKGSPTRDSTPVEPRSVQVTRSADVATPMAESWEPKVLTL